MSEAVRGLGPGRTEGKYSGVADPVPKNTVLVDASTVTGVQTLPPPAMRLPPPPPPRFGGGVPDRLGPGGGRFLVVALPKTPGPVPRPPPPHHTPGVRPGGGPRPG